MLIQFVYNAILCKFPTSSIFLLQVPFQRYLYVFNRLIILGWEKWRCFSKLMNVLHCNRNHTGFIILVHNDLECIPSNNVSHYSLQLAAMESIIHLYAEIFYAHMYLIKGNLLFFTICVYSRKIFFLYTIVYCYF